MTSSNTSATVYISLGSNIQPEVNLVAALLLLRSKCALQTVSQAYRTPPQGFVEQDDFLNIAVCITTVLSPITLKIEVLDWIEQELKRVRNPNNKNAPRTIDLDISLWNTEVLEYGSKPWRIPDPDILNYAHVALPLAEIAPDYVHPVEKCSLKIIASRFTEVRFQRFRLSDSV